MAVNGLRDNQSAVRRKVFVGDVASMWTPDANPAPTTARGRRRIQNGKAKRKAPGMLVVGRAHRPHTSPPGKGVSGPQVNGHVVNESHSVLRPLTKSYKKGGSVGIAY